MSIVLLAEQIGQTLNTALLKDEKLMQYQTESLQSKLDTLQVEQVFLGKVDRVVKGMSACFVILDKNHHGFLPFSERLSKTQPKSGETVLVQIKKPPVQEKEAYLTEDISLAGRLAILLPFSQFHSISQRITDEKTRARLTELCGRIAPEHMGLILREESQSAKEDEITGEIETLLLRYESLIRSKSQSTAPTRLSAQIPLISRILRDCREKIDYIELNELSLADEEAISLHLTAAPMALHNVQSKLEKSLRHKLWLDCGGFLVIDVCEAMTVIDVNSGKFLGGKKALEENFLTLNLEAATEIARILRLRNIGGIILIDFVDMEKSESYEKLKTALEKELAFDPNKTVVHGFTSLGLLEMTRRKTGDAMQELKQKACPYCHGSGRMDEKADE